MEFLQEWFSNFFSISRTFEFKDFLDIAVIAFIIYSMFKLVRETRAEQLLKGIIVLLVVYFLSAVFSLNMLNMLLKMFFEFAVILIAIIFQPEIRKALEQIGRSKISRKSLKFIQPAKGDEWRERVKKAIVDVADTSAIFSRTKTGALIVFERETMLSDIAATGTILDASISVALFGNIFFNKAPLHDGACIIRDGIIHSAGCILPLTKNKDVDVNLGTRHRASLGMSEESDAVVLVVSEETGTISLAINGVLRRDYSRDELIKELETLLIKEDNDKTDFLSLFTKRKGNDK